jgi:putative endonuclease
MRGGWVYIMTNRPNGTLYVVVTADLARRVSQHRAGNGSSFTAEFGLTRLVYAERFADIRDAIQREKTMKHWVRAWKMRTIMARNVDWADISDQAF